jgi:hypothetical protein
MSDYINCPHCSTTMASYATICPGCGAELVFDKPGDTFSFLRLIVWFLILSVVTLAVSAYFNSVWILIIGGLITIFMSFVFAGGTEDEYVWRR